MVAFWIWLTLASSFFITFQRIIQKKVLNHEHASEYLTTFCLLMWILLLPFVFTQGLDLYFPTILMVFFKSIFFSISALYIIRANRHLDISTVEPLKDLGPLFVLLLAIIFLDEIPTQQHLIGFSFLVLGTFLLNFGSWKNQIKHPLLLFKQKYLHYVFFALFVGGISAIFDKSIVKSVSTLTTLFFLFLFTSIFLFIHQLFYYNGFKDVKNALRKEGRNIFWIALISLVSDWLYFKAIAIPEAPLSLVIPLRKVSVIFVVLFGGEMFHEKHLMTKLAASLIILAGIFLITS